MTSWIDALEAVPRWGQVCAIVVALGAALLAVSIPTMLERGADGDVLAIVAMFLLAAVAVLVDVVRVGLERAGDESRREWSGD